ncbi:hypothetical protein [Arenimonas caeni]|uniref:hypothetical protein n=1 Tax=Arenimonas caeni TaxID=2058085 RepID=UPI0013B055F2|nr:hypothetical protein [Arenimonas caeni]
MKHAAKSWHALHGTWANKAPEYWFTVSVAQSLQGELDDSRKWVCVEPKISEMVDARSSRLVDGHSSDLRLNGRCDLAVQRVNEDFFAAVEIKIRAYAFTKAIEKDIRRLCFLLDRRVDSKLSICCLAIYTDASRASRGGAKKKIAERFDDFASRTRSIASSTGLRVTCDSRIGRDPDAGKRRADLDHWGVQCLSITR